VKEGNTARKAGSWTVVGGGLLITAAVIALFNPRFGILDLREVVVQGNHATSAAEIVSASELARGQNLLTLSVRSVRARVSTLPWIKSVSVRRSLPHALMISVEERNPICWMGTDNQCLVLGEGGVVVSGDCALASRLPEIVGGVVDAARAGGRLVDHRMIDGIEQILHASLPGLLIRRIDVSDVGSIRLETEQGVRVLLGGLTTVGERLVALAALCQRFDMGEYDTIDLRFGGEAVLAPRKAVKR